MSFLSEDFQPIAGAAVPVGYAVLSDGSLYVAVHRADDSAVRLSRSGFLTSLEEACRWAHGQAFRHSDRHPNVGELWGYAERVAIICGNSISETGVIWVMDWSSGDRADALLDRLEVRPDRYSLTHESIIVRFAEWARDGNSDAMWWLGWWFEGRNHRKSVWFYVAALRANPRGHRWALSRIAADAKAPIMCQGVASPRLSFLGSIPEIQECVIGPDWAAAVANAEAA
ncbi:MAG: hypothetical protein ACYCSN_19340 [Acidobacteriaceae bacterium]